MASNFEDPVGAHLEPIEDRPVDEADQLARLRAKYEMVRRRLPAPNVAHDLGELDLLESRLDAALEALQLTFDPTAAVPLDALNSLRAGDEIAAVNHYRRATGASFREAQRLIRSLDPTRYGSAATH
ncbi:MAG: hypothetical protein AAF389_19045 [Gemmatimonadota bacterium]